MYEKYHEKGFELIAFPANQFGCQAPYSSEEEREYAYKKFGFSFPVMDMVGVKNKGTKCGGPQEISPLYSFLKDKKEFSNEIEWNYVKFLVDRDGQVRRRYGPGDPLDQGFEEDLIALLNGNELPAKKRTYLGAP